MVMIASFYVVCVFSQMSLKPAAILFYLRPMYPPPALIKFISLCSLPLSLLGSQQPPLPEIANYNIPCSKCGRGWERAIMGCDFSGAKLFQSDAVNWWLLMAREAETCFNRIRLARRRVTGVRRR